MGALYVQRAEARCRTSAPPARSLQAELTHLPLRHNACAPYGPSSSPVARTLPCVFLCILLMSDQRPRPLCFWCVGAAMPCSFRCACQRFQGPALQDGLLEKETTRQAAPPAANQSWRKHRRG